MDENGCVYDTPVYQNLADYKLDNAGTSLFQELLADVEKEAQAKYNAKLTKEQGMCLAQNNGGIMGAAENGSTFMWVKLNSNKIPKNYNMKRLTTKQFKASNDLYGSFCRARITVTSDDKDIQNELGDKATAYFAVGDAFTCGSWIDNKVMAKISEKVGERKLCEEGYGVWDTKTGKCSGMSAKEKIAYAWGTVAPALAGGAIGTGLTESGVLGKWLNKSNNKSDQKQRKSSCISYARNASDYAQKAAATDDENQKAAYISSAKDSLKAAKNACDNVVTSDNEDACPTVSDAETPAVIEGKASLIKSACENASDNGGKDISDNKAARIAIPIATTLAGGALGAGITASVLSAKKEDIKNKAVAEWMEEIGEHIQCYLGAEELGSYGDVISFTIE